MNVPRAVGRGLVVGLVLFAAAGSCRWECNCHPDHWSEPGVRTTERTRYNLDRAYATKYAIELPVEMTFAIDHGRIPEDRVKHGRPNLWKDLGPQGPYISFSFVSSETSSRFERVEFLRVRLAAVDREEALHQLETFLQTATMQFFGGVPCEVLRVERRHPLERESMSGHGTHTVDRVVSFASCRDPTEGSFFATADVMVPRHSRHGVVVASSYRPGNSPVAGPEDYERGITASIVESLRFGDEIDFVPR